MAHCFFAAFVVLAVSLFGVEPLKVAAGVWFIAGVKEFYIDKHFEIAQTFRDNFTDWSQYVLGTLLALATLALV